MTTTMVVDNWFDVFVVVTVGRVDGTEPGVQALDRWEDLASGTSAAAMLSGGDRAARANVR